MQNQGSGEHIHGRKVLELWGAIPSVFDTLSEVGSTELIVEVSVFTGESGLGRGLTRDHEYGSKTAKMAVHSLW